MRAVAAFRAERQVRVVVLPGPVRRHAIEEAPQLPLTPAGDLKRVAVLGQ